MSHVDYLTHSLARFQVPRFVPVGVNSSLQIYTSSLIKNAVINSYYTTSNNCMNCGVMSGHFPGWTTGNHEKPVRMARVPVDIRKMYLSNQLDVLLLEPNSPVIMKVFILTTLIMVRYPARAKDLPLIQNIETGSEVHPTPYSVSTGGSFLVGKIARA